MIEANIPSKATRIHLELWTVSGAHYMNTNTRSCAPGFSKYTRSLRRRAQELSDDIWHSYIDQHRHAVHRWKALELYFSMPISVKTWNSCPPDFWQWAPLWTPNQQNVTVFLRLFLVDWSAIPNRDILHAKHWKKKTTFVVCNNICIIWELEIGIMVPLCNVHTVQYQTDKKNSNWGLVCHWF